MSQAVEPTQITASEDELAASVRRSQEAWRRLGMRLRSITPAALARSLMVLVALIGIGWLLWTSWTSLIPFQIGIVLAYITLPLVNRLDRVMPRWLAVLLVILGELLFVALSIALLVPVLADQISRLVQLLPSREEMRSFLDRLAGYVRTLPEPVQVSVRDGIRQMVDSMRSNLDGHVRTLLRLVAVTALGLVSTLGFIISLLVIPTWLFAVLHDQRRGSRALDHLLPDWMQPDFWAVVQIVDRTLGAYLRGMFLTGLVIGMISYAGLTLLERLGWPRIEDKLALAIVAGLAQLIPSFGPILAAAPAVLSGLTYSWQTALAILALYVLIQRLNVLLLTPLVAERRIDIHPAFMAGLLVIASRFGLVWVFLVGPLAVIVRDLFLYTYGRLSSPPRPAGLLPGEPLPAPQPAQARHRPRRRSRRAQPSSQEGGQA